MYNFNVEALTWDSKERIDRAKIIAEKIYEEVKPKQNGNAMEYGCGTGLISFNLADKLNEIVLMDSVEGMIDVLNKKIKLSGNKNMKSVLIDLEKEEHNEKFDLIYNSMVLHHIIDTEKIVRKFYEMLNKDGILCIVDLDIEDGSFHSSPNFNGHNGFDQEYIVNILKKAGFTDVKIETFYHFNYNNNPKPYSLFCISGKKK
jgi:ubiquinone/menaquinone biosynthesis C-methylase UbiE